MHRKLPQFGCTACLGLISLHVRPSLSVGPYDMIRYDVRTPDCYKKPTIRARRRLTPTVRATANKSASLSRITKRRSTCRRRRDSDRVVFDNSLVVTVSDYRTEKECTFHSKVEISPILHDNLDIVRDRANIESR